jgi:hypothetical protein
MFLVTVTTAQLIADLGERVIGPAEAQHRDQPGAHRSIVPSILCADWPVRFRAKIPPHTGALPFLRHRSSERLTEN